MHALVQLDQVLAAGHAEAIERALHAVLEHLLEAVPGVHGALAHDANAVLDGVADGVDAAGGQLAGVLLDAHAFMDQGFEQLRTLALGAVEGTHAGHPDLLGGTDDRTRHLFGAGLQVGGGSGGGLALGRGLGAGVLLELGHAALLHLFGLGTSAEWPQSGPCV